MTKEKKEPRKRGRKRTKIELAEFEARVVQLRRNGVEFEKIAQMTGDNVSTVWRAFQRAAQRIPNAEVEQMRAEQKAQLEEIFKQAMILAQKGDVYALAGALKALAQQAQLFGLNAPVTVKNEITGVNGGPIQTEQGLNADDIRAMTDEERRVLRRIAERKLNGINPKTIN